MTDPLHKSFRVFASLFSALGVICTAATAAAAVYPDGLPGSEYKQLVQGIGFAGAAICGSVATGLTIKSKMKDRDSGK